MYNKYTLIEKKDEQSPFDRQNVGRDIELGKVRGAEHSSTHL